MKDNKKEYPISSGDVWIIKHVIDYYLKEIAKEDDAVYVRKTKDKIDEMYKEVYNF